MVCCSSTLELTSVDHLYTFKTLLRFCIILEEYSQIWFALSCLAGAGETWQNLQVSMVEWKFLQFSSPNLLVLQVCGNMWKLLLCYSRIGFQLLATADLLVCCYVLWLIVLDNYLYNICLDHPLCLLALSLIFKLKPEWSWSENMVLAFVSMKAKITIHLSLF